MDWDAYDVAYLNAHLAEETPWAALQEHYAPLIEAYGKERP